VFGGALTNIFNPDNSFISNGIPGYALNASNITGITSNNIATSGIAGVNLAPGAVTIDKLNSGDNLWVLNYVRSPDQIVSNTASLTSLFVVLVPPKPAFTNTPFNSVVDVDVTFRNGISGSHTFSNIALLTNGSPFISYGNLVVPAMSAISQHYSTLIFAGESFGGIIFSNALLDIQGQMDTADPNESMQLNRFEIRSTNGHP
jgi:hypothetical protein